MRYSIYEYATLRDIREELKFNDSLRLSRSRGTESQRMCPVYPESCNVYE